MNEVIAAIITGVLGLFTGTAGFYFANRYLEKKKQDISTKREQLQYVFAPLEILLKMNKREFERYTKENTAIEDKEFIEKNVWRPNHAEVKRIIMERSHLLKEIPEELLELLTHINVWLLEYELVYVKEVHPPPVFVGPKGYRYPAKADAYVFSKAKELRDAINK
jgi:hypothetical protein